MEPVVHMDASTDSPELRAEIALLRTELDKRGGDGYETVLRSLEMIHQERLSTRNRAHAVEAEIISLRQKFAEKLELIESSASAAQDAFLLEISKLAHETANAKAEAERQRILTLEAQARLDALAERETAMSGDEQVLRLHALLKKNDDLHNKLLTSHIQLQQQFGLKEVAEALERRNLEMESLTESSGREVAALKEELLAAKARASRAESEISRGNVAADLREDHAETSLSEDCALSAHVGPSNQHRRRFHEYVIWYKLTIPSLHSL